MELAVRIANHSGISEQAGQGGDLTAGGGGGGGGGFYVILSLRRASLTRSGRRRWRGQFQWQRRRRRRQLVRCGRHRDVLSRDIEPAHRDQVSPPHREQHSAGPPSSSRGSRAHQALRRRTRRASAAPSDVSDRYSARPACDSAPPASRPEIFAFVRSFCDLRSLSCPSLDHVPLQALVEPRRDAPIDRSQVVAPGVTVSYSVIIISAGRPASAGSGADRQARTRHWPAAPRHSSGTASD